MITNLSDLCAHLGGDEESDEDRKAALERRVYKYTDCGAWISFTATGIHIGSIVEGSDVGTSSYQLDYPFSEADYDRCMQAIEEEASVIWDHVNVIHYLCPACKDAFDEDDLDRESDLSEDEHGNPTAKCPQCGEVMVGKTNEEIGLDFPDVWVDHQNLPGFTSAS